MKVLLIAAAAMVCFLPGQQTTAAPAAGIDGKWHFVLDTPGGDREMEAQFAVDPDGKVTGKFGDTAVAGTFKDGHMDLLFTMTSEESGETAPMKITGKVDDQNALTGDWEFSAYNGTFKAIRPKEQ